MSESSSDTQPDKGTPDLGSRDAIQQPLDGKLVIPVVPHKGFLQYARGRITQIVENLEKSTNPQTAHLLKDFKDTDLDDLNDAIEFEFEGSDEEAKLYKSGVQYLEYLNLLDQSPELQAAQARFDAFLQSVRVNRAKKYDQMMQMDVTEETDLAMKEGIENQLKQVKFQTWYSNPGYSERIQYEQRYARDFEKRFSTDLALLKAKMDSGEQVAEIMFNMLGKKNVRREYSGYFHITDPEESLEDLRLYLQENGDKVISFYNNYYFKGDKTTTITKEHLLSIVDGITKELQDAKAKNPVDPQEVERIRQQAEEEKQRKYKEEEQKITAAKMANRSRLEEAIRKEKLREEKQNESENVNCWLEYPKFFNPKSIVFVNPRESSESGASRGFGGNAETDEGTGAITLNFDGLPNYFSSIAFESKQGDQEQFTLEEKKADGLTEKYSITTGTKNERGGPCLTITCKDQSGNTTNQTLVPFGAPFNWQAIQRKPVIYVYSPTTQNVSIKLDYAGDIISEYPKRVNDVWHVTAHPSGKITLNGKDYPYLFWEGKPNKGIPWNMEEGFCVKKSDILSFLEEKLTTLGLQYNERADFITYWLPILEKNSYTIIHFATEQYTNLAKLIISPQPKQLIRIFMVSKRVNEAQSIREQKLESIQRMLDTLLVVEWGGTNLDEK